MLFASPGDKVNGPHRGSALTAWGVEVGGDCLDSLAPVNKAPESRVWTGVFPEGHRVLLLVFLAR